MLRRVVLVRNDVSEEDSASIIRVNRIGELGTMMEVLTSYETSFLTRVTRRNIPEGAILHSHRRENLNLTLFYEVYRF
jgi:demethoxyubiquinone hydroxylase (CLK1/Coq7/Cat5 family)